MYQPRDIELEQPYQQQETRHQLPDIVRAVSREPERLRKLIAEMGPITERYSAAGMPDIEFFRVDGHLRCLILFRSREDEDGGTFSAGDAQMLSGILTQAFEESVMPFVGFHLKAEPYTCADGVFTRHVPNPPPPPKAKGFIGRITGLFNRDKVEEAPPGPSTEMRSKVYIFPHNLGQHI